MNKLYKYQCNKEVNPTMDSTTSKEIPDIELTNGELADIDDLAGLELSASSDIDVPPHLIDQVIGQEHAVEVIRKAAVQRRHVMMIGSPGTGKSMLAKAMAELLPKEELQDILVYPNSEDNNNPIIRTVPAGRGKQIVGAHKMEARKKIQMRSTLIMLLILGIDRKSTRLNSSH